MPIHLLSKYSLAPHGAAFVFLILSFFTLAVIAKYSKNYLQEETGSARYWILFSLFASGILLCGFSANLETFYLGWEMVGLASFFLIGFYQANMRSLENSLIALANYKMCDIFFVLAIFFEESQQHHLAGASLIIATLAKSAQFPFSSWLYRALEGPTPSSTIFYGGLSLHLGAFLLLQYSEFWMGYPDLRLLLCLIGLVSAGYGLLVGSTRSDIKTSFAFASISQVGLIYIELALGFHGFALWHIVGHNVIRTWNYLRAASFFDDFFRQEHHERGDVLSKIFQSVSNKLYFHAFNGFYLDRLFILMRNLSLVFFLGSSVVFVLKHLWMQTFHWEYLVLFLATLLSTAQFMLARTRVKQQVLSLLASQFLVLVAIHVCYIDLIEETYLGFSIFFLMGTIYTLWPALKVWFADGVKTGDSFLGLADQHPIRHGFYLFFCISVTASPGTIQFFLQETLFDDLWNRSHTFMVLSLVCLTLNSFHFFRLGQWAFLGGNKQFLFGSSSSLAPSSR